VASKLTSQFVRQVRRLPFFLVAAGSVSLALQLQSGHAQDAREQVTLDTKTHAVQNPVIDATSGVTPLNLSGDTLTSGTTGSFSGKTTVGGTLGVTGTETVGGTLTTSGAITGPTLDKGGQVVNVKAFGAIGDGVTNDTAAFNAALTSLATDGGMCLVPKGTYLISASGITSHVKSGVHLVGVEREVSILKIAAMPTGALIWGDGDNWSVENLTLDMQDYFPAPLHNYSAIACKGNNWRVAKCSILKIGRIGIGVVGGDNWSIEGNYITKTTPVQTLNQSILVTKYGDKRATNARIIDNVCDGSGILFWGFSSTIARNRISNTGFGSGIATGQVANCHTMNIIGNTCTGGRGFDENHTWVSGFELWASDSVITNNTAYDNGSSGIIVGGQNCVVTGNHSYNNGVQAEGYGFSARYQNSTINASYTIFKGNSAYDTRYPGRGMTQTYGYHEQSGGLKFIKHIGNNYNGNKIGPTSYNSLYGQPNGAEIPRDEASSGRRK
jgi:Pectate lyase superfamily protein